MEKIDTPPVEEVQGLEDTVRGIGGFGSIGVSEKKNTDEKKETNGKNGRNEKMESEVTNETLKGRINSGRQSTKKSRKTTEGSSRLSRE